MYTFLEKVLYRYGCGIVEAPEIITGLASQKAGVYVTTGGHILWIPTHLCHPSHFVANSIEFSFRYNGLV